MACKHQAITWTNVGFSSMGICGTHLREISEEVLDINSQTEFLKINS